MKTIGTMMLAALSIALVTAAAMAKISPTVAGQMCLVNAQGDAGKARRCFTDAGWKDFGKGFMEQWARKSWSVVPGKDGPCCNEKVLWAAVHIKVGDRVVDEVLLIFEDTGDELKIRKLTEDDPMHRR